MNYHNITKDDMLNGDGLRAVLWVAGCGHHCPGCQNPATWDPEGGIPFDEDAENELFAELGKDYISGVTFSGGDPLYPGNEPTVYRLAKKIKELFPDKTVWLYTGYEWEYVVRTMPRILEYIDVLVDGRYKKELRDVNLHWRGSANQRVIDVQASLKAGQAVLHCNDGPAVPAYTAGCPSCGS